MSLFGKKDENLFLLFADSARMVVRAGEILNDVVNDYHNLDKKMARLTTMEHEGDRITQALVRKLNTSFILPFDREDALRLVQTLSTTLDFITGIIDRMILYKAGEPNSIVKEMVSVLTEALLLQEKAFNLLNKVEQNQKVILECCEQIRQLERKQDTYYRNALADLFENEKSAVAVIKWREIYEHIEMAMDHVEDVANLIRNICIKYS
jgi:predicted phosphate transport protein (TIGR00153 family)